MNISNVEALMRMHAAGIGISDCFALRRWAIALHRWDELQCGNGYAHVEQLSTGEWLMVRGDRRYLGADNQLARRIVPDRGALAIRKAQAIIAKYPGFSLLHQGDPRGYSLRLFRPGESADTHGGLPCYGYPI